MDEDITNQRRVGREISSLTRRFDDILWKMAEAIQAKPGMPPEEMDALVDGTRNELIPPVSAFLRRNLHKK
jgi:hypothetical protein